MPLLATNELTLPETSSFGWDIVRVIIVLIILIPVMYFATRLYGRRVQGGMRSNDLHVAAMTPLGQGRHMYVVNVAGRILVLGVTAQHITLLTELSHEEVPEAWLDKEPFGQTRSFRAVFEKKLEQKLSEGKQKRGSEDNQHE